MCFIALMIVIKLYAVYRFDILICAQSYLFSIKNGFYLMIIILFILQQETTQNRFVNDKAVKL